MIFLRFKAEFRYPECPIQVKIYLVRFSCNFHIRVRFHILQCKVSFLWADQVPQREKYTDIEIAEGLRNILKWQRWVAEGDYI